MTDVEMIKNDIQKLIDEAYKQGAERANQLWEEKGGWNDK